MIVALVLVGCSGRSNDSVQSTASTGSTASTNSPGSTAPTTSSESSEAEASAEVAATLFTAVCDGTAVVERVGELGNPAIDEASGLVSGRVNDGVWWTHNDSGDSARIFALDESGAPLATVTLVGAEERDWEDIAIAPASIPGSDRDGDGSDGDGSGNGATIFVGDTGDNAVMRDPEGGRGLFRVFRFAEPTLDSGDAPQSLSVKVETVTYEFPDRAYDVEALIVDPIDGDLIAITKDWSLAGNSEVFRGDSDAAAGSKVELEHVATIDLRAGTLITAADVSPDGSLVALRAYGAVHLFERPPGEPLWAAFDAEPCGGPSLAERQGESLGFAPDGSYFLTVSEGAGEPIHRTAPP